jgi:hypothetical protein
MCSYFSKKKNKNILLYLHVLVFIYLFHFWAIFYVFWQKSSGFAPSFKNLLPQGGSIKYSPFEPGNHYSQLPPRIPHRLFIHMKNQGPKPTYSLVYIKKEGTTYFH